MRERLVFEVADDEFDDGVLAMLGVDVVQRFAAVGDERVVAPEAKQLGLLVLGVQVHATHDQAVVAELRLGQLADPCGGVLGDRLPGVISDQRDLAVTILCIVTPIEYSQPWPRRRAQTF